MIRTLLPFRFKPNRINTRSFMTSASTSAMPSWKTAPYPAARREEHYDEYASKASGRMSVHDPYRWLETPPSESEETKIFVEAQAEYTRNYLQQDPNRQKLKDALTANWNYARFSCPSLKSDGYYYYSFNSGLQAQSVLYRIHKSKLPASIAETEEGPGGELFFDPNRLSTDGTASLASTSFSESGKYLAYGVSRSGSDWTTIYVRKTDTPHKPVPADETSIKAEDDGRMSDVVRYAKFTSIAWTHDDKGFFYQRYPTKKDHGNDSDDKAGTETGSSENAMLYYHTLGTSQAEDILIMQELSEPSWMYGAEVSDDGRYLILSIFKDTSPSSKTWICDLTKTDLHAGKDALKWQKVVDGFGAAYSYIANDDTLFYFQANAQAPKYKVVTFDLAKPKEGFTELVKEDPNSILTSASVINGSDLLLMRSRDVKDELSIHDLKTGQRKGRIGANLIGTFGELRGRRHHKELFFKVIGFSNPGLAYRYSFEDNQGEKLFRATVVKGLQQDEFETQQVFYESKDVTRVPMFIVTPRGVPQDGNCPALLYGYGGFSISMDPFFSPEMLTFCKAYGARLCVANIRGGSEYGEDWHRAGTKERKQNVLDDFQYAAKYLAKEKYTAHKKLAIYGGSNGGLLVAACANQAPELFGCVLSAVGVLDMLRFHKFTIGAAWRGDYGDPDIPEDFDYLYPYSPVHNVKSETAYPPVMLLTGDHDDRVSPLHSFKFIAALQHQLAENPNPLLLRVALKAGHGSGKSTQQRIEEATDRFSFAATSMGLSFKEAAQAARM